MLALSSRYLGKRDQNLMEWVSYWKNKGLSLHEIFRNSDKELTLTRRNFLDKGCEVSNICQDKGEGEGPFSISLATNDENRRTSAVQKVFSLAKEAKSLGTPHIILYPGRVELPDADGKRISLEKTDSTSELVTLRESLIKEREKKRNEFLHNLCKSLFEICRTEPEIVFSIPSPRHFDELPLVEEFGLIMDEVKAKNLAYWHETGNIKILEKLGLSPAEAWLESYGSRISGVHLDDVIGYNSLHPAGSGEVDFSCIKPYLPKKSLEVITVSPQFQVEDLHNAVRFLQGKGFGK